MLDGAQLLPSSVSPIGIWNFVAKRIVVYHLFHNEKKSDSIFWTFRIRTDSIEPLAARISCGLLNCWSPRCPGSWSGCWFGNCLSFITCLTLRMEADEGDSRCWLSYCKQKEITMCLAESNRNGILKSNASSDFSTRTYLALKHPMNILILPNNLVNQSCILILFWWHDILPVVTVLL